ncbi:sulfite exporter TauE/SafE family protein [Solicola sp. PLA-1-18]|uniref:sulfite exporter TauE/SafE family protein n=1 Tax=Solicola sp. PLA-1-18 TaxID=3380532 RepID=UPI003B80AAEA
MRKLIIVALVGFFAQMIDGSLGMAYGVTSSTLLIATGTQAAVSGAVVHLSELGTTLASGASHWKFGNVDWRLVSILAVPGGIGAYAGATFLSGLDPETATPIVSAVLLLLGVYVLYRFVAIGGRRPEFKGKLPAVFLAPLGLVAGAVDGFGGGGWGPVGTPALLSSGKVEPRKAVGSIDTSEFVVALGASIGFLTALGTEDIDFGFVGALLVGGVIAAPIAAYVVKLLPARVLGVGAGGLIILTNIKTLMEKGLGVEGWPVAIAAIVWAVIWVNLIVWAVRAERKVRAAERAGQEVETATI